MTFGRKLAIACLLLAPVLCSAQTTPHDAATPRQDAATTRMKYNFKC